MKNKRPQSQGQVRTAQAMLHRINEPNILQNDQSQSPATEIHRLKQHDNDDYIKDSNPMTNSNTTDQFDDSPELNSLQTATLPLYLSCSLLTTRLVLAALFIFSGIAKLGFLPTTIGNTPDEFATAIKKFQLVEYNLIPDLAFILPWVEVVGGIALLLGLASRGAALLLKFLLGSFVVGMALAMVRHIDISDCTCFGGKLAEISPVLGAIFEPPVGAYSILRNLILMALCFFVIYKGPGKFSFDNIAASRRNIT